MFETPTVVLREKRLEVFGIGPETADSILLYAGGHPVFVVDAYTKAASWPATAGQTRDKIRRIRWMVERQFPGDTRRFNELHALIVTTGKNSAASGTRCAISARSGDTSRRAGERESLSGGKRKWWLTWAAVVAVLLAAAVITLGSSGYQCNRRNE